MTTSVDTPKVNTAHVALPDGQVAYYNGFIGYENQGNFIVLQWADRTVLLNSSYVVAIDMQRE